MLFIGSFSSRGTILRQVGSVNCRAIGRLRFRCRDAVGDQAVERQLANVDKAADGAMSSGGPLGRNAQPAPRA